MDRSKALNTMLEAAELSKMIEELMAPQGTDKLPVILSGMRVTMRAIRERILASHEMLAREMVNNAKLRAEARDENEAAIRQSSALSRPELEAPAERPLSGSALLTNRSSLRAALEKQSE